MTQTAFGKLIGTNTPNVSRYVKRGIIKGYGDNNSVNREEALAALLKIGKLTKEGKFISRKAKPYEVNEKMSQHEKEALLSLDGEIQTTQLTGDKLKEMADQQEQYRIEHPKNDVDDDTENNLTLDIPNELNELLDGVEDPVRRISMIKDYWAGKIQRQKFLKEKGELITVNDSKASVEAIYHPMSKKLDNIHIELKARFPEVPVEAIDWLAGETNNIKKTVQEYAWEN